MSQNSKSKSNSAAGSPRGPRQIESDLERNRSRMDDMLDQLQAKFSPDELIDQAKRYARRRSSDGSSSNLQEMVVRNPLPVALIGVGMAWLLMAGRNGSVPHEDSAQDSVRDSARNASEDRSTDSRTTLGSSNSSERDRSSSKTPDEQSEDTRVVVTKTALPSGEQSSETVIRASERSEAKSDDRSSRPSTGSNDRPKRPNTGGDEQLTQVGAGAGHSDPSRGPDPGPGPDSGSTSDRGPGVADTGTSRPASR